MEKRASAIIPVPYRSLSTSWPSNFRQRVRVVVCRDRHPGMPGEAAQWRLRLPGGSARFAPLVFLPRSVASSSLPARRFTTSANLRPLHLFVVQSIPFRGWYGRPIFVLPASRSLRLPQNDAGAVFRRPRT